jgi:hypothetical protein
MANVKDQELNKFRNRDGLISVAVTIENNATIDAISNASDKVTSYDWLDFGTKDQRLNYKEINSPSLGLTKVRFTYSYTLVSGSYRLNSETVSIL